MTDDKKKLPDIPAEAAAPIIAAAAKISGKAAGDLNLEQAIEILQGDNPNPLLNAYINNGAEKAAGALLDDLTDEQAAQLAEAAKNGTLQEALTAAAQELARQIQEGGTTAAGYSEQQERQIIETAAGIAGRSADDLTITEALEIMHSPAAADKLPLLLQGILSGGIFETVHETTADELNEVLQQQGLEPISGAEDQQPDGAEPVKKEAAADDSDDPLARAYIETNENGRHVIRIDPPEYDPTLDPESPEFDREKWEEYQRQASESLKAAAERMRETIAETMRPALAGIDIAGTVGRALAEQTAQVSKTITEAMRPALEMSAAIRQMQESLKGIVKTVAPTFTAMQEYFNSDAWRGIRDTLEMIAATAPAWLELAKEVEELTPYLEAEVKKREYEGKTIDDLLDDAATDDDGNPLETSLFMQALTAARAARDAAAAKEETPHATVKRAEIIEYPLDKPNSIIWNLLEKDTRGQISFNMAKYGSKQQIPAYYAINFDELGDDITITKRLLPFDKRVYIAVSALFNAGNNVITLSQIYYAMGNTGRPSANQLQKINDAVTKMTTARIFFENEQEAKKYKYPRFKYDGSLLPLERGTAIVNGQLADAAIHIFREPPLIAFAKQRNQITTVDVKLLQSPISKTDANLLIDDYLLERISKAKNGKARSCRILFKTLYAKAGIKTKKQEQRAPAKIEKYLNHYQQQEFITRYTMEKDGITVHW